MLYYMINYMTHYMPLHPASSYYMFHYMFYYITHYMSLQGAPSYYMIYYMTNTCAIT